MQCALNVNITDGLVLSVPTVVGYLGLYDHSA
jgi:hypothetical protein